jgi:glycosyltransferase involved in cell wall biosynthesis
LLKKYYLAQKGVVLRISFPLKSHALAKEESQLMRHRDNPKRKDALPLATASRRANTAPYPHVAVLIPCLNEELTIRKVVGDFKQALPGAQIYVFDNNSSDRTAFAASSAGATVIHVPAKGKGNVVRKMFAEIDAKAYVMADGDDTYPASMAPALVNELRGGADMVVGARISSYESGSFRKFHMFGNRLVAWLISTIFSVQLKDVMSGYRVFSPAFVKGVPLLAHGFEVEVEMTLQALAKSFVIKEVDIPYQKRPEGSHSKLDTISDGILILRSILVIFKDYKPLTFFSLVSLFFFAVSLTTGSFPVIDYLEYKAVYHIPLAVLAMGSMILSALCLSIGLVLHTLARYQLESFQLIRRLQRD